MWNGEDLGTEGGFVLRIFEYLPQRDVFDATSLAGGAVESLAGAQVTRSRCMFAWCGSGALAGVTELR